MITHFKMHARDVVEDDSICKINDAKFKELITDVGKGASFGSTGCGLLDVRISLCIAGHGCTILSLVPAILQEQQIQI